MICHVCHSAASGQCQVCARFYCPAHGNLVCAPCAQAHSAQPQAASTPSEPEPIFAEAQPCYECRTATTIKCDGCDNYFCPRHGIGQASWGGTTLKCGSCQGFNIMLSVVFAVVFGIIMLTVVAGKMR